MSSFCKNGTGTPVLAPGAVAVPECQGGPAGGRVIAGVWPENRKPGPGAPRWHTWSGVDSNGDFFLESLPPGQVEIVGFSEGFITQNGPPEPNDAGIGIPQMAATSREGRALICRLTSQFPFRSIGPSRVGPKTSFPNLRNDNE